MDPSKTSSKNRSTFLFTDIIFKLDKNVFHENGVTGLTRLQYRFLDYCIFKFLISYNTGYRSQTHPHPHTHLP